MGARVCIGLLGLLVLTLATASRGTLPASGYELAAALLAPEQRVVDLVNEERAKAGLYALAVAPELVTAARNYANYMATANFFSHTGPDGSTLATRNQAAGYTAWSFLGENLAAGQSTAEAAMSGWMASSGHRANILSTNPREIGVGFVAGGSWKYYWVQEFGSRASAPAPAPLAQLPISAVTTTNSWTSPVTGHTVSGGWLDAYRAMGGLDNLGQPRSGVIADPMMGGQPVQYLQRAVLENHPENPARYRIQRRLLADILFPGADPAVSPADLPPGPSHYFPLSAGAPTGLGHFVANYTRSGSPLFFKDYFDTHGGVDAFGFPKEEPKQRNGLWTQRFQAAVFEYHPENDRDGVVPGTNVAIRNYRVQLALLGDQYIARNALPFR